MIKSNEVRRGNLIEYDGRVFEIDVIADEFPTLNTDEFGIGVVDWNNINPIKITEEKVLELGFIHIEGNNFGTIEYEHNDKKCYELCWNKFDGIVSFNGKVFRYIESIHQLQNFYFAFKNEELIK